METYGTDAKILQEADPVGIAYGIRWCEIVLNRQLDVEGLLTHPPEAVVQWARDQG